jgi:DNA-binding transcriptional MerR regulator
MECLRETKDIRDELHMINRVLGDQIKAITDFIRNMKGPPSQSTNSSQQNPERNIPMSQQEEEVENEAPQKTPETNWNISEWDNLLREVRFRQQRVDKLDSEAEMVERWVF